MMTNQEAIEIIMSAQSQIEWEYPMDYAVAFDMAISALQAQDVPDTNVGDMVSRQKAIDAINNIMPTKEGLYEPSEVLCKLMQLPSVQPEIIRCKDCKHWREGTAFSYCDKLHGMGVLDALDYMTAEDDYCSMAERRTDGGHNQQTGGD